jgi:DNA polymerase III sliding clamp (beta) subunit (PCNA family)
MKINVNSNQLKEALKEIGPLVGTTPMTIMRSIRLWSSKEKIFAAVWNSGVFAIKGVTSDYKGDPFNITIEFDKLNTAIMLMEGEIDLDITGKKSREGTFNVNAMTVSQGKRRYKCAIAPGEDYPAPDPSDTESAFTVDAIKFEHIFKEASKNMHGEQLNKLSSISIYPDGENVVLLSSDANICYRGTLKGVTPSMEESILIPSNCAKVAMPLLKVMEGPVEFHHNKSNLVATCKESAIRMFISKSSDSPIQIESWNKIIHKMSQGSKFSIQSSNDLQKMITGMKRFSEAPSIVVETAGDHITIRSKSIDGDYSVTEQWPIDGDLEGDDVRVELNPSYLKRMVGQGSVHLTITKTSMSVSWPEEAAGIEEFYAAMGMA